MTNPLSNPPEFIQRLAQLAGEGVAKQLHEEFGGCCLYLPVRGRRKNPQADGAALPRYFEKKIPVTHVECPSCGVEQPAEFAASHARYCTNCRQDFFVELCPVCHHMGPHTEKLTPEKAVNCCPWGGHPLPWASESAPA